METVLGAFIEPPHSQPPHFPFPDFLFVSVPFSSLEMSLKGLKALSILTLSRCLG